MENTRYSCQILIKLKFFIYFGKIIKFQISLKSVQWGPSCSMRTEGRKDGQLEMTKLTVAFRNFAMRLKNHAEGKCKHSCFYFVEYEDQILTTSRRHRYQLFKRIFMSNFDCKLIKAHRMFLN